MFIMKTQLLVSLLCVTLCVSAAAVVPVEDVVPVEKVDAPAVPDVAPEKRADVSASVAAADVQVQLAKLEASDETAAAMMEESQKNKTPRDGVPPMSIQEKYPSSCPQGWREYQDHCYRMVNLAYSHINAEFHCETLGANLASAHSLREYSFLKQLAWNAGHLTAWIGGYRFQGYWRWDDGTQFNYNNWHSHSSYSNYDCLYLNSQGVQGWSNERCHFEHPFICAFRLPYC